MAPLGVNVGYHRLLTHKSFTSPIWFRDTLVTIGSLIGAGAPLVWAAEHRVHHRYSDEPMDPHNSRLGFWYSHVFHLFFNSSFQTDEAQWSKYVPDLMTDRYLVWLNKNWLWMAVLTLVPFYYFGGWSYVLWGGFVRLVCTWNIMWLVNSASHKWGYRNFATSDNTKNCWWVGILAAGEGWHNNHHAYQNCAAHGQRWWEFDFSFQLIRLFEFLGLATNVRKTMPANTEIK